MCLGKLASSMHKKRAKPDAIATDYTFLIRGFFSITRAISLAILSTASLVLFFVYLLF